MAQTAATWLEWLIKISLPAIAWALINMNGQIERQTVLLSTQVKEVNELKAELAAVKAYYVTKPELLETLKGVNQQLEIMVLRSQKEKR